MSELSTSIETNAGKPRAVTVDGQTVEQHGLMEQIAADKHLSAVSATQSDGNSAGNGYRGLCFFKFRPPGA